MKMGRTLQWVDSPKGGLSVAHRFTRKGLRPTGQTPATRNWRRKALRWQIGVWEAGMTNLLTTPAPLPTRERLGRLSHSFLAGTVADDLKQFVSSSRPAEVERNAIVQGR